MNAPKHPRMTAEDKQYRARDDVETLTRADAIRRDPERHKMAVEHAHKVVRAVTAKRAPSRKTPRKCG